MVQGVRGQLHRLRRDIARLQFDLERHRRRDQRAALMVTAMAAIFAAALFALTASTGMFQDGLDSGSGTSKYTRFIGGLVMLLLGAAGVGMSVRLQMLSHSRPEEVDSLFELAENRGSWRAGLEAWRDAGDQEVRTAAASIRTFFVIVLLGGAASALMGVFVYLASALVIGMSLGARRGYPATGATIGVCAALMLLLFLGLAVFRRGRKGT